MYITDFVYAIKHNVSIDLCLKQGSHVVLKVLNFEIGFQDLEKGLNLAKMFIKY